MDYGPFLEEFPEVAKEETRQITVLNEDGNLPRGRYLLIELFCTDPECDCRRVFLNVRHVERAQLLAVIAYGWEDRQYYREWFAEGIPANESVLEEKPAMLDELKGPALNTGSPQSKYAPALLEEVESVLEDDDYVDRIERHYRMFKDAITVEE
ncbi:MAG: hypothetical protein ABEH56_07175 [Salinirussus sp.]